LCRLHATAAEDKPATGDRQKDERAIATVGEAEPKRRFDESAFAGSTGVAGGVGFARAGWPTSSEYIDRFGDVLELRRAEITDLQIEPSLDLPVGLFGKTDRAGLGDAFEPRGD
jgi:hypothetical protein